MTILVNDQPAVLHADTAFDYVSKNSLFDNRDDFTLEIAFPLRDCLANQRVFGVYETVPDDFPDRFSCHIIDGAFRKYGVLKVLSVTRDEVRAQFVETVSSEGLPSLTRSLDDIFMDELGLSVTAMDDAYPSVALWDERAGEVIQPDPATPQRSILLRRLVRLVIMRGIGYGFAGSETIAGHFLWNNLLVLNPAFRHDDTPPAYYDFAEAMPHWTVAHFFEQVERLCAVRFLFDHEARRVTVVPLATLYNPGTVIHITPEASHEVETLDDERLAYWKDALLRYSDTSGYDSCQWFIDKMEAEGAVTHFPSLDSLSQALAGHLMPIVGEDEALGRHYDYNHDGYAYHYPGDPQDEQSQNAAFRAWMDAIQRDTDDIRANGYARQFATQLLEAEGKYFLVAEAQTNTVYGVMRRLIPLNRLRDNGGTGEALDIDFTPCRFTDDRLPVIRTPEPVLRFDPDNDTPPLVFNILKEGRRSTAWDTLYVALFHSETYYTDTPGVYDTRTLLWTHSVHLTGGVLSDAHPAYPWFAAIGQTRSTSAGSYTVTSPCRRFKDGELLGNADVDLSMNWTAAVADVAGVWRSLFAFSPPVPFPALELWSADGPPASQVTDPCSPALQRASLPAYDPARKYLFDFLCPGIPDPKAVYVVRGRRYICRQITTRLTASGASPASDGSVALHRGEFYRLLDPADTDMATEM